MKKLAVLIALLLILSPAASALTLTGADLQGGSFQWGSHTLSVSLVSDDPAEVNYGPTPAEGVLVVARFASAYGPVAPEEIAPGARSIALMNELTGDIYQPVEARAQGKAGAAGEPQDSFDLIYYLPGGVPLAGGTFLFTDADGSALAPLQIPDEGALKAIPEKTAAPAAEPTPEPTAAPSPQRRAADFLNGLLSDQAQQASDPWVKAVLEAGAQSVLLEDGALKFSLRSFNPGLKSITEPDPGDAARHLCRNASAYDLECSLAVTDEGGFAASEKDVKALIKAVQKAAGQSKKAFNDKKARVVLAGYLLSEGALEDLGGWAWAEIAPLWAAQSKQALNVEGGPHALKLTTTGANGEELLQKGCDASLQRLAKQEGANALGEEEIARAFQEGLTAQAAALKKKGAEKAEFEVDIDQLFGETPSAGEAFDAFLSDYADAYDSMLSDLGYDVSSLPDYPALDFPKSGRVGGSTRGTKVVFKIPKDGAARFVQMRKTGTDELAVSGFIRPGQSISLRVPKGEYYVLVASGTVWYGPEYLFGDSGDYSSTEDIQIKGSNYYHILTLGGVTDGNMSSYGADPSQFQ